MTAVDLSATQLVGTWELVGLEHQLDGGPWEPAVPSRGRIVYTADGFVSVVIMYLAGDVVPERLADDELTAYSGRYELRPGPEIVHHIDLSFHTSWIGSTQIRQVELGDELVLVTAPVIATGGTRRSRLRWRRPA